MPRFGSSPAAGGKLLWKGEKKVKNFVTDDARNGILCLTFDDSRSADWLAAREIFRQYNARATFFYAWELTAEHLEAMKLLQAEGHSIGLHTLHHKDCLFTEQADLEQYCREEILPQLEILQQAGIRVQNFAYPNNRHTAESDLYLAQYFRHGRACVTPRPEPARGYWIAGCDACFFDYEKAKDSWALSGPGIGDFYTTTHENLEAALVRAAKENKLLLFFSHGIHENAQSIHMKTETLRFCLEKASAVGMKIAGMDELP